LTTSAQPQAIDTLSAIETPEGITLGLRAAGVMPRALAWLIDSGIRVAALMFFSMILQAFGEAGQGIFLILMFLLLWFYNVVFEVLNHGRTPGKQTMKLRVVRANGTPIGWVASFQRNLMRTVDMLPFFYGFGLLACLIDKNSRRIGDRVADTLVVYVETPSTAYVAIAVENKPLPLPLSASEQTALVAFAERAASLTTERQIEIAEQLEPITGVTGHASVHYVLGMAGTILGRSGEAPPATPKLDISWRK
jgi:uncharacterized RDD family membrane protein YckC